MAHMTGDRAVRNRGTIGGSIANNDPAADYPAALLAPGAALLLAALWVVLAAAIA
jgi:aerobic carbon-monoxide dehydrogenase medium subunit